VIKKMLKRFEEEFVGQSKVYNPVKDTVYYGRMSDHEIEEMQARNCLAIQKKIAELGNRWILHPDNKVTRITK
jgi:uncharacterized protein (DUF2147 family)